VITATREDVVIVYPETRRVVAPVAACKWGFFPATVIFSQVPDRRAVKNPRSSGDAGQKSPLCRMDRWLL
jgi:hypothetical protein